MIFMENHLQVNIYKNNNRISSLKYLLAEKNENLFKATKFDKDKNSNRNRSLKLFKYNYNKDKLLRFYLY